MLRQYSQRGVAATNKILNYELQLGPFAIIYALCEDVIMNGSNWFDAAKDIKTSSLPQ